MRRANAVSVFVLLLIIVAIPSLAAQERERTQRPSVQTPDSLVVQQPDSVVKVRKPGVGPRLPAIVASVSMPGDAAAAAPRGNIVIPVTTALIVLAALVVVLIVT